MNRTQAVARLRELTSKFEEADITKLAVIYEPESALFGSDGYAHIVFNDGIHTSEGYKTRIMTGLVKKKDILEVVFDNERVELFNNYTNEPLITKECHE